MMGTVILVNSQETKEGLGTCSISHWQQSRNTFMIPDECVHGGGFLVWWTNKCNLSLKVFVILTGWDITILLDWSLTALEWILVRSYCLWVHSSCDYIHTCKSFCICTMVSRRLWIITTWSVLTVVSGKSSSAMGWRCEDTSMHICRGGILDALRAR